MVPKAWCLEDGWKVFSINSDTAEYVHAWIEWT